MSWQGGPLTSTRRAEGEAKKPFATSAPEPAASGSSAEALVRTDDSACDDAAPNVGQGPGSQPPAGLPASESDAPPADQRASRKSAISVRRQGIKLGLAAAAASFSGALYLEHGNGLFLAGASTALALIAYWIAEHELGRGGGR